MQLIKISDVIPGMRLGRDIVSDNGLKLLHEGVIITEHILYYLQKWNISNLYIAEEKKEIIEERRNRQDELKKKYQQSVDKIISFIDALSGCNELKLQEVKEVVEEILNYNDIDITLHIIDKLQDKDKYTYQHCINVGIYSRFIGKWLELEDEDLHHLVYAALLHDIGKQRISKEILLKPGILTEEEYNIIKKHPIYGYEMIKQCTHYSHDIALGIMQHHEKEDGSGYPLGIKGEKIHLFAKIISVADIFDAMTSRRVYKEKQSPFRTAQELLQSSFGKLDHKIVSVFVRRLGDFYIGATVVLSNGDIGQIVMRNPLDPVKPLIKIKDRFLDLSKDNNVFVIDILK